MRGPAYLAAPPMDEGDGRLVNISAIDNGWLVTVTNPVKHVGETEKMYKALATILPQINMGAGMGAARGMDEEIDSYKQNDEGREESYKKKMETIQKVVQEAFEEKPSLRKPVETYAFLDFEKMMTFLREELGSAKKEATV